jgi:hypothetical protein
MDEQDIGEHMAGAGAQVAMEVPWPACLRAIRGAGSELRIPTLASGAHDVVFFHCMTASERPGVAEGGERADSHANAGGVFEGLVAQAERGIVGDGVEPHAAGPGRNTVEEDLDLPF